MPTSYFWVELGVRLDEVVSFSVILIAASRYGLARFLSSRAMVFGGECSYSVYLLHPFLVRLAMIGKSELPSLPEFLFRLGLFVDYCDGRRGSDLCCYRGAVAGLDQASIRYTGAAGGPARDMNAGRRGRAFELVGWHLYPC